MTASILGAIPTAVGQLGGGVLDAIGQNNASDQLASSLNSALNTVKAGYGQATNLAQPLYNTATQNMTNLSNNYANGGFSNPTVTPYSLDPNSVFSNPEYQASQKAADQAVEGYAPGKGLTFGGTTQRDLQALGQENYANTYNNMWQQGDTAQTQAETENAANNAQNFQEGSNLASYAPGAASTMENLATGGANAEANIGTQIGQAMAQGTLGSMDALGTTMTNLGGTGSSAINGQQDQDQLQTLLASLLA